MRLLISALLLTTSIANGAEADRVFEQVRGSMVTVTVLDERNDIEGEGSGVVLGEGKIITNCHVVHGADSIRVTWDSKTFPATLELEDSERDLCRILAKGVHAKPIQIRDVKGIAPGETVFAIGNPLGLGLSISAGIVSAIKEHHGQQVVFSSTPVAPGSSGGGLFDTDGKLVAITSAILSRGQNYNRSIPATDIAELDKRGKAPRVISTPGPDPDWPGQAEILRSTQQWFKLEEWSRQWSSAYPTASIADGYLGIALFNQGQFDRAQKILRNATRDSGNASARAYLAITLFELGEKQQANQFLEQAMQLDPRAGFYWLIRADWQTKARDYAALLETTREAARREPWLDRAWAHQGFALHGLGRLQEAAQAYRTSLRLKPGDKEVTSGLATVLALIGANADARNLLTSTASGLASDAKSWYVLGLDEERKRKLGEAERAYRKGIELDPKAAVIWHRLGVVLVQLGRGEEAEKSVRKALELTPNVAEVMSDLAEVLRARGEKIERKVLLEKSYELAPAAPQVALRLATWRYEIRDFPGTIAPLKIAIQANPQDANAWTLLGDALVRMGQTEEAYKALKTAQKIDPTNTTLLSAFSNYHGARGQHAEAIAFSEQSLALNGANAYGWNNKGYSLLKLGRFAEAAQAMETAVSLQPDFATAWINLGEAHLRLKQLGKAISALEKALMLLPTATDAKSYLAQAYLLSKQPIKAKLYADALVQQLPQNPGSWTLLIGIHLALNERKEALEAYDKLKRLNQNAAHELREKTRAQWPPGFAFPQ